MTELLEKTLAEQEQRMNAILDDAKAKLAHDRARWWSGWLTGCVCGSVGSAIVAGSIILMIHVLK